MLVPITHDATWQIAGMAYLLLGILSARRLDRRIAGARVQLADYVLGPLFLPLIAATSASCELLRKVWRLLKILLAFHPRDE